MLHPASNLSLTTLVALIWYVGPAATALAQCEITPITATDGAADDRYGWSTGISGDYAVVGAYKADSNYGAAYIYERGGLDWYEISKLLPEVALADGDEYGRAVAISGGVAVVGARRHPASQDSGPAGPGAVFVFRRDPSTGAWEYKQKLTAADAAAGDQFGGSVAIDGDWIVVGAPENDEFGFTDAGTAYAFHFDGSTWVQALELRAGDQTYGDEFGNAVAISGHWVVVGSARDDDSCTEGVQAANSGSVYTFFHDPAAEPNAGWEDRTKLQAQIVDGTNVSCDAATSDNFGYAVAISGDRLVVGSIFDDDAGSSSGSAYVYRLEEPDWVIEQKLTASDAAASDGFGRGVGIHGDLVLVGAWKGDKDNPVTADSGSAYLYRRAGTEWIEEVELTASDAVEVDRFGQALSINGDYAVVGAYRKDVSQGGAYVFAIGVESDCDEDGVQDDCEILAAPALDSNGNGALDSCECSSDSDCGDGLDCTIDSCGAVVPLCIHDVMPGFCAIDDACYVGEEVDPVGPCRICDPTLNARQWSPRANGIACTDDDLFCTGPEICLSGLCRSTGDPCALESTCNEDLDRCDECFTDADCDDIASCTVDSCVGGLCLNEDLSDGTLCTGNGVFCDGLESCFLGHCLSPGNPCLALGMFCDADRCVECLQSGDCDDGNECTSNICTTGECVFDALSAGASCGDDTTDTCTTADTCDGLGACLANHVHDGTICETDGNDCTEDTCDAGACTHPPHLAGTPCGDQTDDECTAPDTCNGLAACVSNHETDGALCPDGLFCNGTNICIHGGCEPPGDPCGLPTPVCDETHQTCVCGNDADCDDGDECTGVESCDAEGVCRHILAFDCNGNELEDACDVDIETGGSPDCNHNGVPDECDLSAETSDDCNGNGIPDECDVQGKLIGANDLFAMEIDPKTALATPFSGLGLGGFTRVRSLAFDANTNTVYAADAKTGVLFTIDPASGATAIVGQIVGSWPSSQRRVVGLAFDPNTTTLYGSMDRGYSDSKLITIDLESGVHSVVGSFGFRFEMRDLAFDPQSKTLFGVGSTASSDERFFTIDVATGIAQLTGGTSHSINGLAFDPSTGSLYGSYALNSRDAALVTIDPATGRTSSVGPLGRWRDARGLAFDPHTNTLLGAGSGDEGTNQQQLLTIDTDTGAGTALSSFGFRVVSDLAFDDNTGVLYGSSWPSFQLLTIDMATGVGTAVGPLGAFGLDGLPLGFLGVGGLAFDSRTNTLYGSDTGSTGTHQLITIDTATGTGTPVGPLGYEGVFGLAIDPDANTLYGADADTDLLLTIDMATGAGTAVGPLGFSSVFGLAFDRATKTLYGTDRDSDQLLAIDTTTGTGIPVGRIGLFFASSLAFNSDTRTLFGTDSFGSVEDPDDLTRIDTATGIGSRVGVLDFDDIEGLAFDPDTETLYGAVWRTDELITIDLTTGEATVVGPLGFDFVECLAFDRNENKLYGTATMEGGEQLIAIDPSTGAGTPVGLLGFEAVQGLAFDPNSNTLYGTDLGWLSYQLITIDVTTGAGTAVGSLGDGGQSYIYGLTFDSETNTLFGTDSRQVYAIDTTTGATTALAPGTFFNVRGLAYVPDSEGDCNANGLPDECDVDGETDSDCNGNEIPDECDLDSDADQVPDDCDVCPDSNLTQQVVIDGCATGVSNQPVDDGCSMNDLMGACIREAHNLGERIACIVRLANDWRRDGLLVGKDMGPIAQCAARAPHDRPSKRVDPGTSRPGK